MSEFDLIDMGLINRYESFCDGESVDDADLCLLENDDEDNED